ncbi:MAG: 3-deoxy-8-phosphooctulonate synthase [Rickettsiaceae bacterium]
MKNHIIKIRQNNIQIANHLPFTLIAGPCQIENLDHALFIADKLMHITSELNINFIYKSSFDKANRTSVSGMRGVGLENGLDILKKVKEKIGCPIVTDVHNETQCAIVSEVADILQIPAFLCRQTDLLAAAAKTQKIINVKKGQFLAPWDMAKVYEKLIYFGAKDILLTERGTSFGYNNLVSDMRSLSIMAEIGAPVVFDATHSVQKPASQGHASSGERKYVALLSKAAISVGIGALFIETHQDPDNAPSDGPCMVKLDDMKALLTMLKKYDNICKENIV